MTISATPAADHLNPARPASGHLGNSASLSASAVSWGAIFAGAAAAAALSLILLMLGVGLGMSSVSPWSREGISAQAFGMSTIVWLTLTQLLASAMGGYIAGRLRSKWVDVHTDEVYFRDTAHGFLAWAVASLATAALLTSAVTSIVGGGVQAGAQLVGGVASTATSVATEAMGGERSAQNDGESPLGYYVDSLLRRGAPVPAANAASAPGSADGSPTNRGEDVAQITRIFQNANRSESLPREDIWHVGRLVAQHTGLTQLEAEKRVADVYASVQTKLRAAETSALIAAEQARKTSAYSALWLFVSLLIGAFVASLAATFGGRSRDE